MAIARRAREELRRAHGNRLRGILVFGSAARGEMTEDSDLDIAVILDEVASRFEERERIADFATDLCLSTGVVVNFFFVPESDYLSGRYAVYRAIRREGVPV